MTVETGLAKATVLLKESGDVSQPRGIHKAVTDTGLSNGNDITIFSEVSLSSLGTQETVNFGANLSYCEVCTTQNSLLSLLVFGKGISSCFMKAKSPFLQKLP